MGSTNFKTPLTSLPACSGQPGGQSKSPKRQLIERLQRELQRLQSLVCDTARTLPAENSLPRCMSGGYEGARSRRTGAGCLDTLRPTCRAARRNSSVSRATFAALLWGIRPACTGPAQTVGQRCCATSPDHVWWRLRLAGANQWWSWRSAGPRFAASTTTTSSGCLSAFYRGDPPGPLPPGGQLALGWRIVQQNRVSPTAGRVRGRNHPRRVGGDGAGAAQGDLGQGFRRAAGSVLQLGQQCAALQAPQFELGVDQRPPLAVAEQAGVLEPP